MSAEYKPNESLESFLQGQKYKKIKKDNNIRVAKGVITIVLLIAMVLSVVMGRVETFDLTEWQALDEGYFYWLSATFFAAMIILVRLIPVKRGES